MTLTGIGLRTETADGFLMTMPMPFAPDLQRDSIQVRPQRPTKLHRISIQIILLLVNLVASRYFRPGAVDLLPRIERTLHTRWRTVGELEGPCAKFKIDKPAVSCESLL
jgi:hypothetical protein